MAEWDYEVFWKETMNQLCAELGEQEFFMWFTNMEYLRGGENCIFIRVPSSFYRDLVKKRYENTIVNKLSALTGKNLKLDYEIGPVKTAEKPPAADEYTDQSAQEGEQNSRESGGTGTDKKNTAPKQAKGKHPQLVEDYTFDKYVIGENNDFAANAALAISKNPGKNSCFYQPGRHGG